MIDFRSGREPKSSSFDYISIRIAGFTDSTGSESYNQQLSERRAEAVKNALAGAGVNPARMTTAGYGESQPIASNDTDEGRSQNRRVELNQIKE